MSQWSNREPGSRAGIARRRPSAMTDPDAVLKGALIREFKAGWKAGCRDALKLALGLESSGGVPFTGPLTPEFEVWAAKALIKLEEGG